MAFKLIKGALLNGELRNILIDGDRFSSLDAGDDIECRCDEVIDAQGMAILPPFYNTHNHCAMTLLRGYADDMELFKWLREYIWPFEEKMTDEMIEIGSRLAILEMIKSGTVFFSDMYMGIDRTIKAVEEMGIRAAIGVTFVTAHSQEQKRGKIEFLKNWSDPTGGRISLTIDPHAIYTADENTLRLTASLSDETGFPIHTHLSETVGEVESCIKEHGMTPVRYLEQIGLLDRKVIAAHVVHVDDGEIDILKRHNVTIAHCPCSNMKLSSGIFPSQRLMEAGCDITLGTDGCSSNNSLDMRSEMKTAALLAKVSSGNPETLPAGTVFQWATINGARAFGIDAGEIAVGRLADALLIDLNNERLVPCHHLLSNYVYAADSSCIDTVICNGKVIMRHRRVDGEEEIIRAARNI